MSNIATPAAGVSSRSVPTFALIPDMYSENAIRLSDHPRDLCLSLAFSVEPRHHLAERSTNLKRLQAEQVDGSGHVDAPVSSCHLDW